MTSLRTSLLVGAVLAAVLIGAIVQAREPAKMGVEAAREAVQAERMVLVDIRTPAEWRETGIPDVAVPLDMRQKGFVQSLLALREAHPDRALGLICAVGGRSAHVAGWLRQNGVEGVVDVSAGMLTREGWLARGLPVRAPDDGAVPRTVRQPQPPWGCRGTSC